MKLRRLTWDINFFIGEKCFWHCKLKQIIVFDKTKKWTKNSFFLNVIDEFNVAQTLVSAKVEVYSEPCQTSKIKLFAITTIVSKRGGTVAGSAPSMTLFGFCQFTCLLVFFFQLMECVSFQHVSVHKFLETFIEHTLRLKQNSALSIFVEKLSFTVTWLGGWEESTCDWPL